MMQAGGNNWLCSAGNNQMDGVVVVVGCDRVTGCVVNLLVSTQSLEEG